LDPQIAAAGARAGRRGVPGAARQHQGHAVPDLQAVCRTQGYLAGSDALGRYDAEGDVPAARCAGARGAGAASARRAAELLRAFAHVLFRACALAARCYAEERRSTCQESRPPQATTQTFSSHGTSTGVHVTSRYANWIFTRQPPRPKRQPPVSTDHR